MEEIIIEIDLEGNPKVSVKNCPGPSCKALTHEIEKAIGSTVKDKETEEFYAKAKAKTGVVNRA